MKRLDLIVKLLLAALVAFCPVVLHAQEEGRDASPSGRGAEVTGLTEVAEEPGAAEAAKPGGTEQEKEDRPFEKIVRFNAVLQNLLVIKNDSDFDGTKPYYDESGQSVGILGTFFKPRLTLLPIEELRIVWEMELGLNLWSRNDPDQYRTGETSTFQLANRELFVEGDFYDEMIGFKIGYQYFSDPSALFIGHWLGAAQIRSRRAWSNFSFTIGQIPDQTYEGVTLEANNFRHDTFVYGLRTDVPLDKFNLSIGLFGLNDSQIVDQSLNLFTPSLGFTGDYDWITFGLNLAFQAGNTERGASLGDEETTAWATQGWVSFFWEGLEIHLNNLELSPDDEYDRNKTNHAFIYSGKSRSRTILLSEDEIRDRGHNLDEALAEKRGKFYLLRPGYSLSDLTVAYQVADFFKPAFIAGAATVIEKQNALDGILVGVETDLDLQFTYKEILDFHFIGGLLVPGEAAAAYVNLYDRKATNIQFMLETSLSVVF